MRLTWLFPKTRAAKIFECGVSELDLRSVFLPDRKIIYICNPKVAGSSIIQSLLSLDPEADDAVRANHNTPASRRRISGLRDPGAFLNCLDDPDSFIFAFVRNPYSRILSCFRDKIASHRQPRFRTYLDLPPTGAVAFTDFLERVAAQDTRDMNRHWRPQANLIPERIPLSFLGRFETLEESLLTLTQKIGIEQDDVRTVMPHKTGTGNAADLTREEVALINQIYSEDFRRFGYDQIAAT